MEKHSNVISSFKPSKFHPFRFYEFNCHWQTIFGSGALNSKIFPAIPRNYETYSERIETKDGDFFDVEYSNNFKDKNDVVVLLHGLESNSKGSLITNFSNAFHAKGFGLCLVSFRGCGSEINRTIRGYHLGFTEDIHHFTKILYERHPEKKFYLSGFSLGGNVILKFLGELGEEATNRNIFGAAVSCVPFDPVGSKGILDSGFNKLAYSSAFLYTLKQKAEIQNKMFPGKLDIERIRKSTSLGEFDDVYICKIFGYKDRVDYYRQNGSKWWLNKIKIPTICVNAIDDPFIRESSLPNEKDVGEAPVRLIFQPYGGHCGFSSAFHFDHMGKEVRSPKHGWLAEEMSRIINHIHILSNQ